MNKDKGRKKNSMLFLASHGLTFFLNFLFLIFISRWLSPGQFVLFSVLIALMSLLVQISTLGQIPFIIRNFNNRDRRDFDLGWVSRVSLAVGYGLAAFALGVVVLLGLVDLDPFLLSILAVGVMLTAISNISAAIFRGGRRPWSYLAVSTGQKFILLALLLFFSVFSLVPPKALIVLVAIAVSTFAALAITGFSYAPVREWDKYRGREVLQKAMAFLIPISAMNFLILLVPFVERSFLSGRFSDIEVARYIFNFELAMRLSAGLLILMKVVVWPEIATGKPEEEQRRYRKALRGVLLTSLLVLVLAALLAPPFYLPVGTAFGFKSDYLAADFLMAGILFAMLTVVNYTINIGVMLTGRTWLSFGGALIFILSYVALLVPLTSALGVLGAAAALLIGQALNGVFVYFGNRKAIDTHS